MSLHPLVVQLKFTRSEFERCLKGLSENDAQKRILPMNCISWMVGHLADQENRYWVKAAQEQILYPQLNDLVGFGKPASIPLLSEMWLAWLQITTAADTYLDALTSHILGEHLSLRGQRLKESIGTMLLRNIYHYWFHIGEAHAIRQISGHTDLPQFVGDMSKACYKPDYYE